MSTKVERSPWHVPLSSLCRSNRHQRHNTSRAHAHRHKPEVWGDAPDKPNSLSTTTARAALTLPSRAANHYTIQASRGQAKVGSANLRANCRKTAATTKSNTWACNSRVRLDAACSLPREPPSSEHAFPAAMFVWSLKPRCLVLCPRRNLRGKNTATNDRTCSTCITHFVMPRTPAMLGTLARHINYDMDESLRGAEFHSRRSTKQLAIKHKLASPMGEREASSKNDMRVTHLHAVVAR